MRTNNLNNQLKNTEQYSKQSINSIMRALKELRTELNKSGQYNKSNAVKDFSKNFFKEEGKQNISDKAESINKSLSKIGNQEVSDKWINSFKKAINTAENEASKVEKIGDRVVTGLNKAFSLAVIAYGVRKLASGIGNIANEYISLVETNNLFQVSMKAVTDEYGNVDMASSTYYQKALNFQNEMSEKLGANKKELENYQSIYMNMFSGQGISNDISYMLSESLTKAGYDLASLYNKDISTTMENLQSGISGQPEGLRKNFGIDISEGTLNGILDNLGIERSIDQLSYAEKEVARYIAILQQAGNAQGDFARTIDSPSNQLKILSNQFAELKQVAGSFVVNWFGGLIVYINAIIMAVKEVLTYFATLFGYDLDFGGGTLTDTSNTIGDIGTGLSDASGKAKELKKHLMGFDEINNIDKPSSSSGGGSGGASGAGIDSKLLDALKEWDNKMESIQGKAQKIRDEMLKWLGFERDDDGTWKLKEGYTNFEKIKECVTAIGIAMGTWTVAKAVTNVLDKLGILSTTQAYRLTFGLTLALTGIYLAYKGISHLIDGDIDLFSILETVLGTAGGTFGIVSILKSTKLGSMLSLASQIRIGAGITITITSISLYFGSKEGLQDGNITSQDILKSVGGIIGATVGIGLLTKNIPLTLILSAGIVMDFITTIGHEQLWYPLKKILDIDYIKNSQIGKSVTLTIDIISFEYNGLKNIFGEKFTNAIKDSLVSALKKILLKVADFLDNFGGVGKGIADAIRNGIKAEENNIAETTTATLNSSVSASQDGTKQMATTTGMALMQNAKTGISNQKDNLRTTIEETQKQALKESQTNTNETAKTSGIFMMQNYKTGISSQQETTSKTIAEVQKNSLTSTRATTNATANESGSQTMRNYNTGLRSRFSAITATSAEIGRNIPTGISKGISDNMGTATRASIILSSNVSGAYNVNGYGLGYNTASGVSKGISAGTQGARLSMGSLASAVWSAFKTRLGINSPSRVMQSLAKYVPEGVALGIKNNTKVATDSVSDLTQSMIKTFDKESENIYDSIGDFQQGIAISTKDTSIDATSYVNYGAISGNITAQSQVQVNDNIVKGIATAVANAVKDINVNIEAKTEEGVIVKKATEGIKDFVRQTGELPFPVPV